MHTVAIACVCTSAWLAAFAGRACAAEPAPETLAAWDAAARLVERDDSHRRGPAGAGTAAIGAQPGIDIAELAARDVPGGTVQHWRGATFLAGVRLDRVLEALKDAPPQQSDVLASRVLWREGPRMGVYRMGVYLRLVRHSLITVTYDTEHEVVFERVGHHAAIGRSVMTQAREVRGAGTPDERVISPADDRGFLWRLNVYWSYTETPSGVRVVMESLTLGRATPGLLRPIAAPMVRRIAEESVRSALEGLRARFR